MVRLNRFYNIFLAILVPVKEHRNSAYHMKCLLFMQFNMLRAKYVNKRYKYLYRSNIQTVEEVHIRFINTKRSRVFIHQMI